MPFPSPFLTLFRYSVPWKPEQPPRRSPAADAGRMPCPCPRTARPDTPKRAAERSFAQSRQRACTEQARNALAACSASAPHGLRAGRVRQNEGSGVLNRISPERPGTPSRRKNNSLHANKKPVENLLKIFCGKRWGFVGKCLPLPSLIIIR